MLQVAEGTKYFPHPLQDSLLYIFSNNLAIVLELAMMFHIDTIELYCYFKGYISKDSAVISHIFKIN